MTRSTLARRYAPLVALAVLQLLIIGFVPSKAGKASGQQVATANGAAGPARAPARHGAAAAARRPPDRAPPGLVAAAGGGGSVGGAPPGVDVGGDTTHCVNGREFDPAIAFWAPPCVPGTIGATGVDNGGDTYSGVTNDEITLVDYVSNYGAEVNAILAAQGSLVTYEAAQSPRRGVGEVHQRALRALRPQREDHHVPGPVPERAAELRLPHPRDGHDRQHVPPVRGQLADHVVLGVLRRAAAPRRRGRWRHRLQQSVGGEPGAVLLRLGREFDRHPAVVRRVLLRADDGPHEVRRYAERVAELQRQAPQPRDHQHRRSRQQGHRREVPDPAAEGQVRAGRHEHVLLRAGHQHGRQAGGRGHRRDERPAESGDHGAVPVRPGRARSSCSPANRRTTTTRRT